MQGRGEQWTLSRESRALFYDATYNAFAPSLNLEQGPNKMIADVLHFAFTVRDIDRSVDWYTRVLGLRLVHRQRGDNPYTRQLVGIEDAVLEVAQFAIPATPSRYSTHMLELIQYVNGAGSDVTDLSVNRAGTAHIGFIVTDIHGKYQEMIENGVTFVNPPVMVTEGANVGGYACYFRDPDGITLEIMQFAPERAKRLGLPDK